MKVFMRIREQINKSLKKKVKSRWIKGSLMDGYLEEMSCHTPKHTHKHIIKNNIHQMLKHHQQPKFLYKTSGSTRRTLTKISKKV